MTHSEPASGLASNSDSLRAIDILQNILIAEGQPVTFNLDLSTLLPLATETPLVSYLREIYYDCIEAAGIEFESIAFLTITAQQKGTLPNGYPLLDISKVNPTFDTEPEKEPDNAPSALEEPSASEEPDPIPSEEKIYPLEQVMAAQHMLQDIDHAILTQVPVSLAIPLIESYLDHLRRNT